ncbi:MAG: DNA topoisomerase VI subunit B [bacterium]|nr:DNA topoisomerase VI subunit B [bacterium]
MSKQGSFAFAGAKGGKKPAGTARKAATKKAAKPAAKKAGRKKAAKPAAKKAGRKKAVKPTATKAGRKKAATPRTRTTANEMASKQRDISVSEFFAKNRHLLGFDNPSKALLTTVKEGVDNALDACEEAGIAPDIRVEIHQKDETRFRIAIEDNGPGIVKSQVPKIFGRLLYGSKFHRLRQSRGQQGIGISAAGMYGLLTTGRPIVITTRTGAKKPAHHFELVIDTKSNEPRVKKDLEVDWQSDHGTRVEIELEGAYRGGQHSVEAYIRQISLANPHARIEFLPPNPEKTNGSVLFDRVTEELPPETDEIKPHPYGVELGVLMQMFRDTKSRNVRGCLQADFSRVSGRIADEICTRAKVPGKRRPSEVTRDEAERVHKSIQATKIMSPPTDCIAPIGEDLLESALRQEVEADFYASVTRKPTVYRGNPFMIEVGLAYGGKLSGDDPVTAFRFANRVPLQYQQGACAITKAITGTDWKAYRMQQPRGAMPVGPMLLMVHIASVWVPFTSESKEAVAQYPEILKELRLGLQECGRRVATHIRKQRREADEEKKRAYIVKYIPQVAVGLQEILGFADKERDKVVNNLTDVLEKSRKL